MDTAGGVVCPLATIPGMGPVASEPPRVTVRYWAAARAAAGCTEEEVAAATVSDALAAVRQAHRESDRFDAVLAVSSLLLGEQPVTGHDLAAIDLRPGDVIEVLPPFAGG